jgi:hypothetical protein
MWRWIDEREHKERAMESGYGDGEKQSAFQQQEEGI